MSLDERKRRILGAVVRDYVQTVKPVGSEDLAARHAWGVKSATIRGEMAELSDMGYLRQPHTSAGRIPSDLGYRFYVDHLMTARPVRRAPSPVPDPELSRLLRQTCALLTRQTSYTAVATPPRPTDTTVTQVFVSPVANGRLLLVLLLSTGQMQNRLVPDAADLSPADITTLGGALSASLSGRTLDALGAEGGVLPPVPSAIPPALRLWLETLQGTARQMARQASEDTGAIVEGAGEILRQPEFRDADKLEGVLETLEARTGLLQTLSRALLGPDVTVVIGTENPIAGLRECSVITASYFVGTRERGMIGVVGPTRMDYDRAVPAVGFFARILTRTLSSLHS